MISFILMAMFAAQLAPKATAPASHAPQLISSGSMVGMAYGAGSAIYFSASHDSGRTFGAPVKVAEAEVVPLNRHRGPRITLAGATLVITAVTGHQTGQDPSGHSLPPDGDLIAWHSADGGKTWSNGVVINDVPGAAREGLHALAGGANGRVFAVWLDKRGPDGTRLFGATSDDGGRTWSRNSLVYGSPDGTVCQCCHPSAAADPSGQTFVMWRNCLGGARDMYLARSQDGRTFTSPLKLGIGSWQLSACPMDGGGLAVYKDRVVTAWRREKTVYLAEPGSREEAVGEGTDVALAVGAKGPYVAWVGSSGIEIRRPQSTQSELLSRSGRLPALAITVDGAALVAWEDGSAIKTMRVDR